MKKLEVDQNKCIGCGMCAGMDPDHFEIDDSGLSTVINQDNIENETISQVIEGCPTGAITIEEIENEEKSTDM